MNFCTPDLPATCTLPISTDDALILLGLMLIGALLSALTERRS